jgi:hypothetical protein
MLKEIERDYFGHDETAINKHSTRTYEDDEGNRYMLDRTTDGIPPFFSAYGPYKSDFKGLLPRLLINGKEYWGNGMSWKKAEIKLREALCSNAKQIPQPSGSTL